MSHPNQLALAQAAEKWIEQSQALPDHVAIERLTTKINTLQDGINLVGLDRLPEVMTANRPSATGEDSAANEGEV